MYTSFLGAFFGALVLPAVSSLFATWFEPQVASDGQFAFAIVAAVPIGAVLGLVTAFVITQGRRGDKRAAHQVAIAGGIAGLIFVGDELTLRRAALLVGPSILGNHDMAAQPTRHLSAMQPNTRVKPAALNNRVLVAARSRRGLRAGR
jgi:MFS family permease